MYCWNTKKQLVIGFFLYTTSKSIIFLVDLILGQLNLMFMICMDRNHILKSFIKDSKLWAKLGTQPKVKMKTIWKKRNQLFFSFKLVLIGVSPPQFWICPNNLCIHILHYIKTCQHKILQNLVNHKKKSCPFWPY
jgi:hypothetical protein